MFASGNIYYKPVTLDYLGKAMQKATQLCCFLVLEEGYVCVSWLVFQGADPIGQRWREAVLLLAGSQKAKVFMGPFSQLFLAGDINVILEDEHVLDPRRSQTHGRRSPKTLKN